MFSSRRRRRSRSSSTTFSSPRRNNFLKPQRQRLDRYSMKRTSGRSDDDDDRNHRRRYSRSRTPGYRMNRKSPTVSRRRRRSPSSDFEDFRRKYSPLEKSRRNLRQPRSNSAESDNYRHHKYPPSKRYVSRRSRSYSRRSRSYSRRSRSYSRSRRSNSFDSKDYRQLKRPVSKRCPSHSRKPSCLRRRRFSSSPDSRDSHHHRRPASVMKKRKPDERNNSDVDILEGKLLKHKYCRSRSLSKNKPDVKHSDQIPSNMHRYYEKSGKYMEEGKLKKALKGIELALELCEKDDKFLSQIYSRKGNIYSLLEKPRSSFQAFLDWEHAFIIDMENTEARKSMSKVLFMGANKYYRMKSYDKALISCNSALELNKNNGEAFVLQQLLKKKFLDKIKKRDMKPKKLPFVPKSEMKCISEKTSIVKPECINDESISEQVRHLARSAAKATHNNNSTRALIYVNQALRLYETADNPDQNIFRQLLVLKQNITNWNSPVKKLTH